MPNSILASVAAGLVVLTLVGCNSDDSTSDDRNAGQLNAGVADRHRLRIQNYPLIDVRRNAVSSATISNFVCNWFTDPCLPNAVLLTNRNWGDVLPENWQPDQLLMAANDGLKDVSDRLLPRGRELFAVETILSFGNSTAACAADFNNDGYMDLVVVNKGAPHRLYINQGQPRPGYFTDQSRSLHEKDSAGNDLADHATHDFGDDAIRSWRRYNTLANSCTTGDIDGDGYDDIIVAHSSFITTNMLNGASEVLNPRTVQVFINDRNHPGTFRDESRSGAIIPQNPAARLGAVKLFDADGDGDLDLILGGGFRNLETPPIPTRILLNDGQGVFATTHVLEQSEGWNVSIETAVIENKRTIFVVNSRAPHRVYQHRPLPGGEQHYDDVTDAVLGPANDQWGNGVNYSVASGTLADVNGDGLPDLITVGASQRGEIHTFVSSAGPYRLRRQNGLFSAGAVGQIYGLGFLDANGDGVLDALLVQLGFSDVWTRVNGVFQRPGAFPSHGNMDPHGAIGDANGDGFLDYLEPGFRNFHQSVMLRRDLPNQYYLNTTGGFKDVSTRLPQPQLDNFKDCRAKCAGQPDEDSCMEQCDLPDKCVGRCTSSCGASVESKTACFNACSWDRVRHQDLASYCVQRCQTDCAVDCSAPNADAQACADQAIAGYCGPQGSCISECQASFDLKARAWQRFYQVGAYKGWRNTVVEETSGLAFIDYDNDGRKDVIVAPSFQPPFLLRNTGSGLYALVDQGRLPCRTERSAAPVVVDLNGDGNNDVIFYSKWQPPRIWYGVRPAAKGVLFEQVALEITNWADHRLQKFYALTPIDADADGRQDFLLVTNDLDTGAPTPVLLINQGGHRPTFRVERIADPMGAHTSAQCRNHSKSQIQPCVGDIPGAFTDVYVGDVDLDGRADIIVSFDNTAAADASNRYQTRAGSLLLNRSTPGKPAFADYSRHLHYDLYDGRFYRATDGAGRSRFGVRMRGTAVADFDGDRLADVMVSDFETPVFLKNLGPQCWAANQQKCLVDRTLELFGTGHTFDGKYGAKNYGLLAGDFNSDGIAGFILRAAAENLWYEAGGPRR
jgi:hypothetical protein